MTKAYRIEEFGGPEVLRETDLPTPEPGAGQVRIAVRAAGVNPVDYKIRSGAFEAFAPTPLPAVLGIEAAGVVEAVGPGVAHLSVGDEVFGFTDGGAYAEQALATTVVRKPAGVDWTTAAALPVAIETTRRVLALLDVREGETVLVHGAAGAVGQVGVQLLRSLGATVIGTAGPGNQDRLRELGATPLVYGEGLVERVRAVAPQGVDAVFDVAGRGALPDSIELRGGTSRIVTIADPAAQQFGVQFTGGGAEREPEALTSFAEGVAAGTYDVAVGRTFPLDRVAEAHAYVEGGHATGKTVLIVA
ncbi:NADP-dependent oxidoreductase [Actinosynnema sp. NPDC020468]|uniref:NADP-dependent oxidoreductase n=1 Tax=Actinosynnema sp. NPDC020468 TaxID=3154488 RepID=UPI0033F98753